MQVRVAYFAMLRDLAGSDSELFDLPDGSSVGMLLEAVGERHPDIAARRKHIAVVSGESYIDTGHKLKPGEEIALIPPVSGGCW